MLEYLCTPLIYLLVITMIKLSNLQWSVPTSKQNRFLLVVYSLAIMLGVLSLFSPVVVNPDPSNNILFSDVTFYGTIFLISFLVLIITRSVSLIGFVMIIFAATLANLWDFYPYNWIRALASLLFIFGFLTLFVMLFINKGDSHNPRQDKEPLDELWQIASELEERNKTER